MRIKTNRNQVLTGFFVQHTESVKLSPEEVDKVFYHRLAELTEGYWLKGNEVWQTLDSHGHGSDMDERVGKITDPELMLPVAALKLRQALIDTAV